MKLDRGGTRMFTSLAALLTAFLPPRLQAPPSSWDWLLDRAVKRPVFKPYERHPRCPYAWSQRRRKALRKQRQALRQRHRRVA